MRPIGAFQEKVAEVVGELCDNDLRDETVEKILEAHCEVFALYTMSQLMAAQESASDMAAARKNERFQFFRGKIQAYQELFLKVAFDGLSVEDGTLTDEMMQNATLFWEEKVGEFIAQAFNQAGG